MGERSYPVLTYPDLVDAIEFYEGLGFTTTFRQLRPYPSAVVSREDLTFHLSGVEGFDPASSLGSVIVTTPDVQGLHDAIREAWRAHAGTIPTGGIPRMLRLRRKAGTATGFTIVDVGGNWIRVYGVGAVEDDPADRRSGLARVIDVAARQGDARGDDEQAIAVLSAGLERHPDAPTVELIEALRYRAELLGRVGRSDAAAADAERADSLEAVPDA